MTAPDGKFAFNLESESVLQLNSHLSESLKLRILNIPLPPGYQSEHQVRVAILFSGGLDCTVLARMAHDILPSDQYIDLLNVAFENPRVVQAAKNAAHQKKRSVEDTELPLEPYSEVVNNQIDVSPYENCPDRETGRKAFQELQTVCPSRAWRFVAVSHLIHL
jgi:asparagine synthetase B (glutamine-hydrolysing)